MLEQRRSSSQFFEKGGQAGYKERLRQILRNCFPIVSLDTLLHKSTDFPIDIFDRFIRIDELAACVRVISLQRNEVVIMANTAHAR